MIPVTNYKVTLSFVSNPIAWFIDVKYNFYIFFIKGTNIRLYKLSIKLSFDKV